MSSWSMDIEWNAQWKDYFGLGRYNLVNAWKLDYVLAEARRCGLRIHLVLENHGKASSTVDEEWDFSPYNQRNGGPLQSPVEFFSRADVRGIYKKKLRYIVARWGYDPTIMGFELWSEVNLTGDGNQTVPAAEFSKMKVDWHKDVATYLKRIDHNRHLLTTHFSGDFRAVRPELVNNPEIPIDYVSGDAYRGRESIVGLVTATAKELGAMGKPVLITEYGGSSRGGAFGPLDADIHTGLWASYMTNLAGTPLLWWFMYIDLHDKYPYYQALANYARGEDKRGRALETVVLPVTGAAAENVSALALRDARSAYVWVFNRGVALSMPPPGSEIRIEGLSLAVGGLEPGRYVVEVWDTYRGEIVETKTVAADGGKAEIALPAFANDVALKIKPAPK